MPDRLSRADLPAEFTPETLRTVPMAVLRRLASPGNGVLDDAEQQQFDAALHDMMRQTLDRVNQQLGRTDWQGSRRAGRDGRRPRGGPRGATSDLEERNRQRIRERIQAELGAIEQLSPGATALPPVPDGPEAPASEEAPSAVPASGNQTVSDAERSISDQVELVQVMNEIADVSRRTYDLEQQREASNTRGVFFGFLVSIAVIIAGWAPLVSADWHDRIWILIWTLATCLVAGAVYALVRFAQRRQLERQADTED